ncbi:hypothetical protein DT075_36260 [Bacillus licheniformis]|nr:hypothetical protein DT075_36260 [Bacillus licheniformis]
MANVLGMSKKTLVQIEKGRSAAGWAHVVAVCALFRNSEVLQAVLGDEPLEVVETKVSNLKLSWKGTRMVNIIRRGLN